MKHKLEKNPSERQLGLGLSGATNRKGNEISLGDPICIFII
jgi:hypothetical protein